MSGQTHVRLNDIWTGFARLTSQAKDMRPVFREMRPVIRADLKAHFAQREGISGTWAPRAPSSVKKILATHRAKSVQHPTVSFLSIRKKKQSAYTKRGKIKARRQKRLDNQLGRLKYAYRYEHNRDRMVVTNRVPWAGIHQFGGTAGHGAVIPQREFTYASDQAIEKFRGKVFRHLLRVW